MRTVEYGEYRMLKMTLAFTEPLAPSAGGERLMATSLVYCDVYFVPAACTNSQSGIAQGAQVLEPEPHEVSWELADWL